MSKRKRQANKKLIGKDRTNDAKHWLQSRALPKNIIEAYSNRYAVSEMTYTSRGHGCGIYRG